MRSLAPAARSLLARVAFARHSVRPLCTTDRKSWDAASAVHGTPKASFTSIDMSTSVGNEEPTSERQPTKGPQHQATGRRNLLGQYGASATSSSTQRPGSLSPNEKADLLQFQVYVRQRLSELSGRLPPRMSTRERAELAFLEEQVVQDQMPARRRRIRDPLRDVDEREIRHTNLPLLSRFVSEAGAILPKRLTGVSPGKQRRLTRAIKRAQVRQALTVFTRVPAEAQHNTNNTNAMPIPVHAHMRPPRSYRRLSCCSRDWTRRLPHAL